MIFIKIIKSSVLKLANPLSATTTWLYKVYCRIVELYIEQNGNFSTLVGNNV